MRRGEKEVGIFKEAMLEVLNERKNSNKGGWEDCSTDYLKGRLLEEVVEVYDAHKQLRNDVCRKNIEHLQRECCDVANFAMMIHDNLRKILEENNASMV